MESSESPLMTPHKSKKALFFTTPNEKRYNTDSAGPAVATPEKASLNPGNRIRDQNFSLLTSDIHRSGLKSNLAGSDLPNVVSENLFDYCVGQKSNGSEKSDNILPEKHEMLCDFFTAMLNSIRLLRLKKVRGSFSNLARKIESLTDRRFTLHHLAQFKYIVPEVIMAKKHLVEDEKSNCMKEELLVSLEMGAVEVDENAKGSDRFSKLKNMFRSRIVDYCKTHPEDDDIPVGELPHLFYEPKNEAEPTMNMAPAPLLMAPSFKRRFSSKSFGASDFKSMPTKSPSCFSKIPVEESTSADATDGLACAAVEADAAPLNPASTPSKIVSTPAKLASTPAKLASIPVKLASTPAELVSTPARLMAATPVLRTQKRPPMTPDHDCSDFTQSVKRSKSLKFDDEDNLSRMDEEESIAPAQGSSISKNDVLEVLPDSLLQSLIEKERRTSEEKDPIVVNAMRRKQMMTQVPRLFDMIRLLFQSIRRSVITKEELIYKLLSGNLEIIDKIELEEQIQLLQEVAPEFMSEKQSISGDTLLSLNKCTSPDIIRAKLLEA